MNIAVTSAFVVTSLIQRDDGGSVPKILGWVNLDSLAHISVHCNGPIHFYGEYTSCLFLWYDQCFNVFVTLNVELLN